MYSQLPQPQPVSFTALTTLPHPTYIVLHARRNEHGVYEVCAEAQLQGIIDIAKHTRTTLLVLQILWTNTYIHGC